MGTELLSRGSYYSGEETSSVPGIDEGEVRVT